MVPAPLRSVAMASVADASPMVAAPATGIAAMTFGNCRRAPPLPLASRQHPARWRTGRVRLRSVCRRCAGLPRDALSHSIDIDGIAIALGAIGELIRRLTVVGQGLSVQAPILVGAVSMSGPASAAPDYSPTAACLDRDGLCPAAAHQALRPSPGPARDRRTPRRRPPPGCRPGRSGPAPGTARRCRLPPKARNLGAIADDAVPGTSFIPASEASVSRSANPAAAPSTEAYSIT